MIKNIYLLKKYKYDKLHCMDIEEILTNVRKNIDWIDAKVDSIIIENGNKVISQVFNEIELHELRSCSKLVVAFCYGLLIENGKLSLDTKIYDILKNLCEDIKIENQEIMKQWTIRTLLTHSTGFSSMLLNEEWLEKHIEKDVFKILFNIPIENKVNVDYTYSNLEPYLCSVVYQELFGESLESFAKREIFDKLNIKNFVWKKYNEYTMGATGLYLNYKDFHKLGKLLFSNGIYDSKQIIPEWWVREMKSQQINCQKYYKPTRVFPKLSAGYFTFLSRDNIIFRDGSNGQYIICDSKNDILISLMATDDEMSKETEIFRNLI